MPKNSEQVKAIVVALTIVEQLAFTDKALRLDEFEDIRGVSQNVIRRYLRTLVELGYVLYDSDTEKYRAGIRPLQLGSAIAEYQEFARASQSGARDA